MINLKEYRQYWENLASRSSEIRQVLGIAVEQGMADKIMKIGALETPVLFYLPPSGEMSGGVCDFVKEKSLCTIFIMKKYDPRQASGTSLAVLEETQDLVEAIKNTLIAETASGVAPFSIDMDSVVTLPETEFFANWAGWSISFNVY